MKIPCEVSKKTFKTEDGREVGYVGFEVEIGGQTFYLLPRKEDKKLISYILADDPNFEN